MATADRRDGGRVGWRGSDVTTEIKSNANTKLHYPSRTLADPSSLPSCSHTLPRHTPPRPFLPTFFHCVPPSLSPSLFPSPPSCFLPTPVQTPVPHEIPAVVP